MLIAAAYALSVWVLCVNVHRLIQGQSTSTLPVLVAVAAFHAWLCLVSACMRGVLYSR